jgi:hypothetical protein
MANQMEAMDFVEILHLEKVSLQDHDEVDREPRDVDDFAQLMQIVFRQKLRGKESENAVCVNDCELVPFTWLFVQKLVVFFNSRR